MRHTASTPRKTAFVLISSLDIKVVGGASGAKICAATAAANPKIKTLAAAAAASAAKNVNKDEKTGIPQKILVSNVTTAVTPLNDCMLLRPAVVRLPVTVAMAGKKCQKGQTPLKASQTSQSETVLITYFVAALMKP